MKDEKKRTMNHFYLSVFIILKEWIRCCMDYQVAEGHFHGYCEIHSLGLWNTALTSITGQQNIIITWWAKVCRCVSLLANRHFLMNGLLFTLGKIELLCVLYTKKKRKVMSEGGEDEK